MFFSSSFFSRANVARENYLLKIIEVLGPLRIYVGGGFHQVQNEEEGSKGRATYSAKFYLPY